MKVFEFRGETVNLGRFGKVKAGDTLVLTDQEANDIRADKRFKPVKQAEVAPADARKVEVLQVQELDPAEARKRLDALQAKGKAVDVRKTANHPQMVKAILEAEQLTD